MRSMNADRPTRRWPLACQFGLALSLVCLPLAAGSGPMLSGKSSAQAAASAVVLDPININGVVSGLFSVVEMLAPLQGAASPATGSVLIRLVNTAPAVVNSGSEGGTSSLSLLLASGRSPNSGGLIAFLNSLLAPFSGGTLQRELVAAVTLVPESEAEAGASAQPARERDERVAIVVAFN